MRIIDTIFNHIAGITFIILFILTHPVYSQTNLQNKNNMLSQLGIIEPQLPPKLQDTNAPPNTYPAAEDNTEGNWTDNAEHIITRSGFGLWNNYDDIPEGLFPGPESWRVGEYTPIDLLKMHNGTIITTEEQWWNMRRPEMLKDVQEEVWGVIPDDSVLPGVTWSMETSAGGTGNSAYIQKLITGTIDISRYPEVRNVPQISAVLRIPANASKPVPVMIVFAGFGNPIETYWSYALPNGWGVCIFNPGVLQPDNGAGLTSYLIGLVNKGDWRKPTDWGTLGAWSWGVSRLIDYFETDEHVNEKEIGLTGHSRYGKATLVAMAYEPRLAIAFPSCGGSLGTKMNRRHWGQDLENSGWDQEYHWVAGNFFKWMGPLNEGSYLPRKIENCPVDAHSLLALCAPRPVFLNSGTQDLWTDPYGIYLTGWGAVPVYELLGKQGLVMPDEKPLVDTDYIEGNIGYRYHNGGHTDAPDWPAFFKFASKYIIAQKLIVSSLTLNVASAENSSAVFNVISDTSWNITPVDEWLSVSSDTGTGNAEIAVSAEANFADSIRTGLIIAAIPGLSAFDITVSQSAINTPGISLSDSIISVNADSQKISFAVKSNTTWNVYNFSSRNWIMPDMESGYNTRTINLVISANSSSNLRSANITVAADNAGSRIIKLTQAGKSTTPVEKKTEVIKEFQLMQNFPNPFNPSTSISYRIPEAGHVSLKVYNVLGSEIASLVNKEQSAGQHSINFDASGLAGGVYFYSLKSGGKVQTRRMILVK
ncbi:MAG: T9SS type A sorting domain-containing protein [Ignavibacteriaceae bacterium]